MPDRDAAGYTEAVRAFYTGTAAVQVGENAIARTAFRRVTELAPGEPAGWANLGLVSLLMRAPDEAAEYLERARDLAPEHAGIQLIAAVLDRELGDLESAIRHLRRAVELEPDQPRSLSLLARMVEETGGASGAAEAGALFDRVLAIDSGNVAALLERARLAAKAGDRSALRDALEQLGSTPSLPDPARDQLGSLRATAEHGDLMEVATGLAFLATELEPLPSYRQDRQLLDPAPGGDDLLIAEPLNLPRAVARPAPADTTLRFQERALGAGGGPADWVRALWLDGSATLAVAAGRPAGVWVGTHPDSGRTLGSATPAGIEAVDYDYDFRQDLVVAGPGGLRLYRNEGSTFGDVTGSALPATDGAFVGIWALDLDMEGDMDLVAARAVGPPLVLRNRGDGRFERVREFEAVEAVRDLAWADLDADGDPDAALLDADGRLHVYRNRRQGTPRFLPDSIEGTGGFGALAVADLDQDARFELLVSTDSALLQLDADGGTWRAVPVARWPSGSEGPAPHRLFVADLDNNGQLDVVASTPSATQVWLSTADSLVRQRTLDLHVTDVADVDGDARLDLMAVAEGGDPVWLENQGDREYFAAVIRPRAVGATGDRRINSFGIGGEIEVRAGLLYQKQPIRSPTVHLGLGDWPQADVARILWPNGTVQAEFGLSGQSGSAVARQRLKGSCPWVFTHDGDGMRFVTDFLWRTALGLRINAQGGSAVIHSEDWIRIPGDALRPRDGHYDVRITAELWETHFFDRVQLMVVDHPAGTEVLVDERFAIPAPPLELRATGPLGAVAARDQAGRDVSREARARDGHYVDSFRRGTHQGLAEEHFVEVVLPAEAPVDRPLVLAASGWIYPTDSSINLALAQGDHPRPSGLRVEVPDGRGGWVVLHPDLGFPAGKTKTILIDLDGAFPDPDDRRVRLRTNMEIYWDRLAWAEARPETPLDVRRIDAARAQLRYRGFSEVRQPTRATPEIPDYDRLATTAPVWRDLVGFHTRFGDVRPLTEATDDRYVIMNAGDELAFRFRAPDPVRPGWERVFVLVGDGWVKDGDYNTGYSTTVRPLPYHGMKDYEDAPGRLEDDPAYRKNPDDWATYHTRYVTPKRFHEALVPKRHD